MCWITTCLVIFIRLPGNKRRLEEVTSPGQEIGSRDGYPGFAKTPARFVSRGTETDTGSGFCHNGADLFYYLLY